jgi:DNA segregation ATPase FtsK/SpoIIIE-like protein
VGEMLRRDREKVQAPRLVVVIDEMADLVEAGGVGVARSITRLTQRGREAGIHVIGCTQKPTVEAIGSLVKSNFPVRLVGSVASPEDAKVASGLKETGAERLLGRGDFLLVVKGQVTRFQAAYVSQQEVQAVVAKLRTAAVSPKPRRWPAETLAATGTDGKDGRAEPANGGIARSEWTDPQRMVGTVARQLRLIK